MVDVEPELPRPAEAEVAAAVWSRPLASLLDKEMKAVLHEIAKSWLNGTVPATDSPWKLWKSWPPTLIEGTHGTGVSGVTPADSRPSLDTTLNVDPGGSRPSSPASNDDEDGRLATASTSPVDGLMATSDVTSPTGESTVPSAVSAASCTLGSMVSVTGWPATPGNVVRGAPTGLPSAPTSTTDASGVPASLAS